MVAIRFLFGAGEAGAFPNIARSFSRWFPARERGRANGVMFLGSRLGGMLSAPVALVIIGRWGWRVTFVLFGLVGVVWAAAWYAWYRDRPEEHPAMTRDELVVINEDGADTAAHARTPWRALLGSRNLYAICAMYFAFGYGLYFYFTWLPTYLITVLGFSRFGGGLFAALPFLLAGIADVTGGWLTAHLSRRYGLRVGRCHLGFAAFLSCGGLVFASTLPVPAVAKAVLLALALASADLALGACWAVPIDIAPDHAGVITGCMNTLGNLGGLVGPLVVGYAVQELGSWTLPFYATAGVYAFGAAMWLAIDPAKEIATEQFASSSPVQTHRPVR
jgi:MFS transporter, ACS family, glucarate transporter